MFDSLRRQCEMLQSFLAEAERDLTIYTATVGYPSGFVCALCGQPIFERSKAEIERLQTFPVGTRHAHERCAEIQTLRDELGKQRQQNEKTTGESNEC